MIADFDPNILQSGERLALSLKGLYKSYGYAEYKLSGFEPYALYADNSSFLDGKGVLSFGAGGRLYALRPDVTLSVIKNSCARTGTAKLFYDERVYRKQGDEPAELRQVGVEVIGCVDSLTQWEVGELAVKTLAAVGEYALDISHAGIIEKTLDRCGLVGGERRFALDCLKRKNAHDLTAFAAARGINADAFCTLISMPSDVKSAAAALRGLCGVVDIAEETAETVSLAERLGGAVNIDFSVGGDSDYYNGIVFKGYIRGVPDAVLFGGRYDRLLHKFGDGKAIGFALYLGELEEYFARKSAAPDVVVVYTDNSAGSAVKIAEKMRASGKSVLLSREAEPCSTVIYAEEAHD